MPDSQRFAGKVALITGGGRGIGKAIALRLAHEGADIAINYFRNRDPAQQTAEVLRGMGRRAELVKANVGDIDELRAMFDEMDTQFGGLDFLINNAASGYNRPVMAQRAKGWDWTMNINARAILFSAQFAAPLMAKRGGGAIVNLSSLGTLRVMPEYVLVGASKAALETLTRYLAVELAPQQIVVNAVSSGFVATEALEHFPTMRNVIGDTDTFGRDRVPAGRMVSAEDVAAAVAFLCSPDAAMIRGQILLVDGGYTLVG